MEHLGYESSFGLESSLGLSVAAKAIVTRGTSTLVSIIANSIISTLANASTIPYASTITIANAFAKFTALRTLADNKSTSITVAIVANSPL